MCAEILRFLLRSEVRAILLRIACNGSPIYDAHHVLCMPLATTSCTEISIARPTLTLPLSAAQASCTGLRDLKIACEEDFVQRGILLFQVHPAATRLKSWAMLGDPVQR